MSDLSDQILDKVIDEFEDRDLLNTFAMKNAFGHKSFEEVSEEIEAIINSK